MKALLFMLLLLPLLAFSQGPTWTCGNFGPSEWENAGTTTIENLSYSAPMADIFRAPLLYGCTPFRVTSSNGQTQSFFYNVGPTNDRLNVNQSYSYINGVASWNITNIYYGPFIIGVNTSIHRYTDNTTDSFVMNFEYDEYNRLVRQMGNGTEAGVPVIMGRFFDYEDSQHPRFATRFSSYYKSGNNSPVEYEDNVQYKTDSQDRVIFVRTEFGERQEMSEVFFEYSGDGLLAQQCLDIRCNSTIDFNYDVLNRLVKITPTDVPGMSTVMINYDESTGGVDTIVAPGVGPATVTFTFYNVNSTLPRENRVLPTPFLKQAGDLLKGGMTLKKFFRV